MKIRWQLRRSGDGWTGVIDVPIDGAGAVARVVARGPDKAQALAKAASIADQITSNPVLAAVLPPQAAIALKATKALAKSAAVGKLADAARSLAGPGVKRLSKALGGLF